MTPNKKPHKNIILTERDKKPKKHARPLRCNKDKWVDSVGVPLEYHRRTRREGNQKLLNSGLLHVVIGRHAETIDRLSRAWDCSVTEVVLRLLRPLYKPVMRARLKKEKTIGNPYPEQISLDPGDWEDEELKP